MQGGLWPYIAGHKPSTEASAWCAIALRDQSDIAEQALSALIAARNPDGGWSTEPHMLPSDWTSGPGLLALRLLQVNTAASRTTKQAIKLGLEHMFDSRTEFYGSIARLLLLALKGKEGLEYARGWPWSPDCYHWIEPTTYALLALRLPTMPDAAVYGAIVTRANQFVLEHECKGGGWNHGSSFCLGVYLPPYIVTTAEALLVLQETPTAPPVAAGLAFLQKTEPDECSAMERAWAILALNAYGQPTENLVQALVRSQHEDGSFGINILVSALSTLALDTAVTGINPLKYTRT